MTNSSDSIYEFEFYCPYCDAQYDNYYARFSGPTNHIDQKVKCDICGNTFRLQTYLEIVIETSKKLEGD